MQIRKLTLIVLTAALLAAPAWTQSTPSAQPAPDAQSAPAAQPAPETQSAPAAQPAADAQPAPAPSASVATPSEQDQVIDRIIAREQFMVENLRHFRPLMETYLQNERPDKELGTVPDKDDYFLGRLDFTRGVTDERLYVDMPGRARTLLRNAILFYPINYSPRGFAGMILVDGAHFDRQHYKFTYLHREFLGDLRCMVFDVSPVPKQGTFKGRIWVEEQEYNIVRFNGVDTSGGFTNHYFHFDSWRQNLRPGLWLPTLVYSEESDMKYGLVHQARFKSQTRLWGYDPSFGTREDEMTRVLVDAATTTKDESPQAGDLSPLQSQRLWQGEAEENVVDKLERVGLVAPKGEVDKVMETVVNNLEITNNLDIQPEIHCRVLLSEPLETFSLGHTIVVSRGLLDVLPDEASLAMVLARELAHITLGHQVDTKFSFSDRTQFPDEKSFHMLSMRRTESEEEAADAKALQLLQNSPYKDKLGNAGLFLRQLQARADGMPHLVKPRLGNSLVHGKDVRMAQLENAAPMLKMQDADQIAALPLGGRIKINAWSNDVSLMKSKQVKVLSAREKMPFEVTPLWPYETRLSADASAAAPADAGMSVASTANATRQAGKSPASADPKPGPK
jgi:peptidase M48-like protein